MKKFILSLVVLTVVGAFSAASLQAQCSGGGTCSGKDKKEEPKKEEPKKN
jgi:hypothetical protein